MRTFIFSVATLIASSLLVSTAQADLRKPQPAVYEKPIYFDPGIIGRPLIDPDYAKECNPRRDEKRAVYYGDLTLETAADIEKFRCLKRVSGDLTFDIDNEMTLLVMPWLERVNGDLRLEAGAYFNKGKFPKLKTVDGDIRFNNRQRSAHWWMPAMTSHQGEIEVIAGVLNDLTGFTALTYVKSLYLRNHPNDIWGPFKFSGLTGVTEAGTIEINLRSGQVNGSFLNQLTQVNGNVEVYLHDGQLFGLGSLQTISGRFIMEDTNYTYHLNNLSSLTYLGGLELVDNAGLNNLDELLDVTMPAGGYIRITDNDSLGDCEAKTLTRSLRNNTAWNIFNGSNTYVYGNGYPDC